MSIDPILITGGAGFIGANLTRRLLSAGHPVTVLDNLSRAAARRNLEWVRAQDDAGGRAAPCPGS